MKEGEGCILDDEQHSLIHLIAELQKIDYEYMRLHYKRVDIMHKIGLLLNKEICRAERDKETPCL